MENHSNAERDTTHLRNEIKDTKKITPSDDESNTFDEIEEKNDKDALEFDSTEEDDTESGGDERLPSTDDENREEYKSISSNKNRVSKDNHSEEEESLSDDPESEEIEFTSGQEIVSDIELEREKNEIKKEEEEQRREEEENIITDVTKKMSSPADRKKQIEEKRQKQSNTRKSQRVSVKMENAKNKTKEQENAKDTEKKKVVVKKEPDSSSNGKRMPIKKRKPITTSTSARKRKSTTPVKGQGKKRTIKAQQSGKATASSSSSSSSSSRKKVEQEENASSSKKKPVFSQARLWRNMAKLQDSKGDAIFSARKTLEHLIRHLADQESQKLGIEGMRFSKDAISALHSASEDFIIGLFSNMQFSTDLNGRKEPTEADFRLGLMLQKLQYDRPIAPPHIQGIPQRYSDYSQSALKKLAGESRVAAKNIGGWKMTESKARDIFKEENRKRVNQRAQRRRKALKLKQEEK